MMASLPPVKRQRRVGTPAQGFTQCDAGAGECYANISYTQPAPAGRRNGVWIDTGLQKKGGFPLRPDTFQAQHGSVPHNEAKLQHSDFEGGNVLVPVKVCMSSARALADPPQLSTLGFQLVSGGSSWLNELEGRGVDVVQELSCGRIDGYFTELEDLIVKITGATAAHALCSACRTQRDDVRGEKAAAGFAAYAHTDQSPDSWGAKLRRFAAGNGAELPSGLDRAHAAAAAGAGRYAVLSAWRYLGPDKRCRDSMLAMLDPRSVSKEDFLPFQLIAGRHFGGNYRLRAPPEGSVERHRWLYYPDMTREEVLLFTVFDSDHPAAIDTFASFPMPTVFHSAFVDPVLEVTRESIDVRLLVYWD